MTITSRHQDRPALCIEITQKPFTKGTSISDKLSSALEQRRYARIDVTWPNAPVRVRPRASRASVRAAHARRASVRASLRLDGVLPRAFSFRKAERSGVTHRRSPAWTPFRLAVKKKPPAPAVAPRIVAGKYRRMIVLSRARGSPGRGAPRLTGITSLSLPPSFLPRSFRYEDVPRLCRVDRPVA